MKNNYHKKPVGFYAQDFPLDLHEGDGGHRPQSLLEGGIYGRFRSLLPPPYDRFPLNEDGTVLWPGWTVYNARMEEFRKKEEKKRKKKAQKKGVWPKANDPYPWEKGK